jgi:hypothetical protein
MREPNSTTDSGWKAVPGLNNRCASWRRHILRATSYELSPIPPKATRGPTAPAAYLPLGEDQALKPQCGSGSNVSRNVESTGPSPWPLGSGSPCRNNGWVSFLGVLDGKTTVGDEPPMAPRNQSITGSRQSQHVTPPEARRANRTRIRGYELSVMQIKPPLAGERGDEPDTVPGLGQSEGERCSGSALA